MEGENNISLKVDRISHPPDLGCGHFMLSSNSAEVRPEHLLKARSDSERRSLVLKTQCW